MVDPRQKSRVPKVKCAPEETCNLSVESSGLKSFEEGSSYRRNDGMDGGCGTVSLNGVTITAIHTCNSPVRGGKLQRILHKPNEQSRTGPLTLAVGEYDHTTVKLAEEQGGEVHLLIENVCRKSEGRPSFVSWGRRKNEAGKRQTDVDHGRNG